MTEQYIRINAEGTNLSAIFYFQKSAYNTEKESPTASPTAQKQKRRKKAEKGGKNTAL